MKATPDPGVAAFPSGKPKPRPIERLHEHQKQVREREGQQTAASAAGSAPLSDTMRQKVLKSIDAIETK